MPGQRVSGLHCHATASHQSWPQACSNSCSCIDEVQTPCGMHGAGCMHATCILQLHSRTALLWAVLNATVMMTYCACSMLSISASDMSFGLSLFSACFKPGCCAAFTSGTDRAVSGCLQGTHRPCCQVLDNSVIAIMVWWRSVQGISCSTAWGLHSSCMRTAGSYSGRVPMYCCACVEHPGSG